MQQAKITAHCFAAGFDVGFYKSVNPDLSDLGNMDALNHFYFSGRFSERLCSRKQFYEKYPSFDIQQYASFYDLADYDEPEVLLHYWNNHDKTEYLPKVPSQFGVCVFVTNLARLEKLVARYHHVFDYPMATYVACQDETLVGGAREMLPDSHVRICDIKGAGYAGGYLSCLEALRDDSSYESIKMVIFFHTVTDEGELFKQLDPLCGNRFMVDTHLQDAKAGALLAACSHTHVASVRTLADYEYITSTFVRLGVDASGCYDIVDATNRMHYLTEPEFYRSFNADLRHLNDAEVCQHWDSVGVFQEHRVNNPCALSATREQCVLYPRGGVVLAAMPLVKFLASLDRKQETQRLVNKSMMAWDQVLGLFVRHLGCSLTSQHMFNSVEEYTQTLVSKDASKMQLGMYVKSIDMSRVGRHRVGMNIRRLTDNMNAIDCDALIDSLHRVKQCLTVPKAPRRQMAVFVRIRSAEAHGSLHYLLRNIAGLVSRGFSIDVYLGHNEDSMQARLGYSVLDHNLEDLVKPMLSTGVLSPGSVNFFLGFKLRANYSVLVATDAVTVQVARRQTACARKIMMWVDDYEPWHVPHDQRSTLEEAYADKSVAYYCHNSAVLTKLDGKPSKFKGNLSYDAVFFHRIEPHVPEKAVYVVYMPDKQHRMPTLASKIINTLIISNVRCYVGPAEFRRHRMVTNVGHLSAKELNAAYNRCSVGIVFSASAPSRTSLEMLAAGMEVIELDSLTTQELPEEHVTKISINYDVSMLVDLIRKLFAKRAGAHTSYLAEHNIDSDMDANLAPAVKSLLADTQTI